MGGARRTVHGPPARQRQRRGGRHADEKPRCGPQSLAESEARPRGGQGKADGSPALATGELSTRAGRAITTDELIGFLGDGGGWRLALEQREAFIAETERQGVEDAQRAQQKRERKPAAQGDTT